MTDIAMTESKLNKSDKERIVVDIKLTLIIGTIAVFFILVLIALIPSGEFLLGHESTDGFLERGLMILSIIILLYVFIAWGSVLKFINLKIGKKLKFRTRDFEVRKDKDDVFLLTRSPVKIKLRLYEDLAAIIKPSDPITIEISKVSKTLLFLSQDTENLLEKIERERN